MITVFVKKKEKKIAKKYYVKRLIVSYCSSMSLIIIIAKTVIAAGFGMWVTVMRQFFFYSLFSFRWPIGLHGSQIIIESSILNYSVICAGHGACNQQFVHAALICRIAALVCVILLSIVIEICNFSNWRNIIIQIIYNNILSTSSGEKVLSIPITW